MYKKVKSLYHILRNSFRDHILLKFKIFRL